MLSDFTSKNALFAVSLLALAACGGGGGAAPVGGATNSAPTITNPGNQSGAAGSAVTLSIVAADADGDALNYSASGLPDGLTIAGATGLISGTPTTPSNYAVTVTVSDAQASASASFNWTVSVAAAAVSVSGKVLYEFVPPNANCNGLNFSATQPRPIRAATVQLIESASGNVLDSIVAADNGDYAFSNVAANVDVRLRVRAELKRTGSPSWDVEVRDNVDTSPNPLPLGSRPLYVIDSASFNTGGADVTRDLTATTGWGGNSYTGTRAAAPFAILDAIYSGMKLVLSADPAANFGPMDAFWSVNNTLTSPTNIAAGELPTSFYRGDLDSLFLLGDASVDTEEFDDHVTVHEWGHYFEDVFSRSDSIGGSHSGGQSLDARLAFGEGWATALAAMALDEPQYCDTGEAGTSSGFGIDTENYNFGPQGWFNEMSVATLLYDLWDTDVDTDANGSDTDSIGFGPIFETMAGAQQSTPAFTTLFSFAAELRARLNDPADQAFLDSQLLRENIDTTGLDIWGSSQDNILTSPNQARDVLPLYTTLPTDGTVINICANSDYDFRRDGNKLAEYRYLRFEIGSPASYTIRIITTTATPPTSDPQPDPPVDIRDQSDPDMYVYRNGEFIVRGVSGTDNQEIFTTPLLTPGTYVADLQEWRFEDERINGGDGASSDFPEQICFDVSMSP